MFIFKKTIKENKIKLIIMKKFMFCSLALLGVLLTFTSCNDDDGYSVGTYYLDYATKESVNSDGKVVFIADNGDKLVIVSTFVHGIYTVEDGDRVYMSYTKLGDIDTGDVFEKAYSVRLNDYREVLTKSVVLEGDATDEEKMNDPIIGVDDAWFSDKFLNIQFFTPYAWGSTTRHRISLIQGTEDAEGYLNLYLRQDSEGDNPKDNTYSSFRHPLLTVSFDISSIVAVGATSTKIRLNWTEYDGSYAAEPKDRSDTGVFVFTLPNSDDEVVTPLVVRMSSFKQSTLSSFEADMPLR